MPVQNMKLSKQASDIHQALHQLIVEKIHRAGGVIDFADYMQAALYTPQLGYYQNDLLTFGDKGDFITAPEMGNLFADCLAQSIAPLFSHKQNQLLEIGAGSGALAKRLYFRLNQLLPFPLDYQILEPSAALQAQQRSALAESEKYSSDRKIAWLSQLPTAFNGVIVANEVIDALPFARIQKNREGWHYLGVAYDGESFYWQPAGAVKNSDLPAELVSSSHYIEGYSTEIRPLVTGWIQSLASCLHQGIILLFDYGYPQGEYYHPQRVTGSMRCFSRHQANSDPLILAGLQDITAHVDFTEVARAASAAGLDVAGFTTQAGYLLENGLLEQASAEPGQATYQLSQQMQKLATPGQMGELVKVIMLAKNCQALARGFSLQDHLHRL